MKTRKGNSCKLVSYNQHHTPGYPEHFEQLHEGNTCFVHVDVLQFAKSINGVGCFTFVGADNNYVVTTDEVLDLQRNGKNLTVKTTTADFEFLFDDDDIGYELFNMTEDQTDDPT